MSLINQMLKDLSNRAKPTTTPEIVLAGLFTNLKTKSKHNMWEIGIGIAIFILLLLIVAVGIPRYFLKETDNAVPSNEKVIEVITNPSTPVNMPLPLSSSVTLLTGMTVELNKEMTSLRFLLNHDSLYRVNQLSNDKLEIILENTHLVANLPPINTMNTAIKIIEMHQDENDNLIFNLTLTPNAHLENLDLQNIKQLPELKLDFIEKPIDEANLIEKNSIKKFHNEYSVDDEFELAKNLSAQGKNNDAIRILEKILLTDPEFTLPRKLLATLYYEQGNFEKANLILKEGLMQRPLYPPYVQLKAEILVDEGKIKEALNLLQKSPPTIEAYPEYHALTAALYQRLGKSTYAEGLYEQLLKIDARNSRWWVGLGIARESQDKKPEALVAFSKASMINTLSPELRSYVESRISNLQ